MTEEHWRPLGVDNEDEIAVYDALHDEVPEWMSAGFWIWVEAALTEMRSYSDGSGRVKYLNETLAEEMAQTLHITLPNLRVARVSLDGGRNQIASGLTHFRQHPTPMQIADYLLAQGGASGAELEQLLERCKSAWRVGQRAGRPGLVRRVPLGVQTGADAVIARAGRAGLRLAKAWEQLYGLTPNPSEAFRQAILAVEDAAIPTVSPKNTVATLGTVLKQMEDQGDWTLPMTREHTKSSPSDVLIGNMRLLWHGQHDRHGGQPSAPGNVSREEAIVAVGIATTIVHWFSAGLVSRGGTT